MNDDWGAFTHSDHGVRGWLGDEPEQELCRSIRAAVTDLLPSLVVERIRVTGPPYALSSAQPAPALVGAPTGWVQTTCAAFALPCDVDATTDGSPTVVRGVFSWLAEGMHTPHPFVSTTFDRDAGMPSAVHDLEQRFHRMSSLHTVYAHGVAS